MSLELRFYVQELPIVVPRRVAGARVVLISARATRQAWRLSWAAVDLPAGGELMGALTDAGGKPCELVAYEATRDEAHEGRGWWEFNPSPDTDGRVNLALWLDEPPHEAVFIP